MARSRLIVVEDQHLSELQTQPRLGQYLKDLWKTRHFVLAYARGAALKSGQDTFLGRLWIVLDPLLQFMFYGFIFGIVLHVSRGMDNFPGFLILGVVFFRTATRGITTGMGQVQKSKALVNSFHFPRASVIFSTAVKNFIDGIAPALVGIGLALAFQSDKPVSPTVLLVIPIYFLAQLFALGCGFIVARATAFIPDLRSVFTLLVRGLFFLSGVFFSIERFVNHETLALLMKLNPIYQVLLAVRTAVLDGQSPEMFTWVYLLCWSLGLVLVGFIYFWRAEARYGNIR